MADIPEDVRITAYAMAMRLVDRDRDSGENADVIAEAILAERERCAAIGYRICAETRHVTLGDQVSAAIRAPGIPS